MPAAPQDVYIYEAIRSPIGTLGGSLMSVSAVELGEALVKAMLGRLNLSSEQLPPLEVVMGHVVQAGCGANVARQIAIAAGLDQSTPGYTVNKVCASGMKAISLAASTIASGESSLMIAGGTESMSQAPFLSQSTRFGARYGNAELIDALVRDALTDPLGQYAMGETAENLADDYNISREEQDEFAARSQQLAEQAMTQGNFKNEIHPIEVKGRKGKVTVVDTDEHPRPGTTADVLAKLKPVFRKDGRVTAGNASGINDGASVLLLGNQAIGDQLGLTPIAKVRGWASAGVDPSRMGIGPVPAITKLLSDTGFTLDQIDLFEINEAFAAQCLAVQKELSIDMDKLNVHGGAIALGHPVGASGARIVTTLIHAMRQQNKKLGVAALCVGGGQGSSLLVENF